MGLWRIGLLAAFLGLICSVASSQDSAGNVITGGAKSTVLRQYSGPALPKPVLVVVHPFPLQGELVPDDSLAERLHQHSLLRHGSDSDVDPQALIKQLEEIFTKSFVASMKKQGIEATGSTDTANPQSNPTLEVSGEFLGVDEGDRTKRIMVGFGRGGSDIKAHIIVSWVAPGQPKAVILECNLEAKSGKQPGAVATMGMGSLAVGAVTHSMTDSGATVQKDAARMGKLIAKEVENAMIAQKWISPPRKE